MCPETGLGAGSWAPSDGSSTCCRSFPDSGSRTTRSCVLPAVTSSRPSGLRASAGPHPRQLDLHACWCEDLIGGRVEMVRPDVADHLLGGDLSDERLCWRRLTAEDQARKENWRSGPAADGTRDPRKIHHILLQAVTCQLPGLCRMGPRFPQFHILMSAWLFGHGNRNHIAVGL